MNGNITGITIIGTIIGIMIEDQAVTEVEIIVLEVERGIEIIARRGEIETGTGIGIGTEIEIETEIGTGIEIEPETEIEIGTETATGNSNETDMTVFEMDVSLVEKEDSDIVSEIDTALRVHRQAPSLYTYVLESLRIGILHLLDMSTCLLYKSKRLVIFHCHVIWPWRNSLLVMQCILEGVM